jgi:uncharacterized membrane protein
MKDVWLPRLASVSLITLIFLCLAWEIWLAPVQPGGSWLMLKAFPLLFPLFGVLHGRRYSYQVSSLLALPYVLEGTVRALTDQGFSRWLALAELLLALVFFVSVILCVRWARKAK